MRISYCKYTCPFCGKTIGSNGASRASHGRMHVREGIAFETNDGQIGFEPMEYKNRLSKYDLPISANCKIKQCVYIDDSGVCNDVGVNRLNSDSKCYLLSIRALLNIINKP